MLGRNDVVKSSVAVLAVCCLLSACSINSLIATFDFSDAEIKAEEAAKVAKLVKKLHEKPHTSFFGAQAEEERVSAPDELADMKAYVAIPDLAQALKDPNPHVRSHAARALYMMFDHAQAAEPALREALNDNWTTVNLWSAWALWYMNAASTELLPVVRHLCGTTDVYSAVRAADLGIQIEQDPTNYIQCLMRGMFDADEALDVVSTIHDETHYKGYLPVLLEGTRSSNPRVRSISVNLLGASVYAGPEVTPVLRKLATQDPNETVRLNAVQSLVTGGDGRDPGVPAGTAEGTGQETIDLLMQLAQGHDGQVRQTAIEALRDARHQSPEFLAALVAAMKDPENDVRKAAVRSFATIGGPAVVAGEGPLKSAWSDYLKARDSKSKISDEDLDYYQTVWWALVEIGQRPNEDIPN